MGPPRRCTAPAAARRHRRPHPVALRRGVRTTLGSLLRRLGTTVTDMQTHDAQQTTPPIAKTVPHTRTHHGDVVVDPYEWLREKSDPEVVAYLEAENAYTEAQTAHLEPLRTAIFDEIKSRTQETDLSVPTRRGLWWYYGRTLEGKSYG